MKRISAIICVIMMAVALMAPAAFAAEDTNDAAATAKTDLELVNSSPEDGATGVAVDNLSVKMRFNKDVKPASDKIKKANAKQFKLVDSEGKTFRPDAGSGTVNSSCPGSIQGKRRG